MTQRRNRKGWKFSSCCSVRSVNSKFWGCLHQLRAFGQMLGEFGIVIQPPKCVGSENEMRRAAATLLLKIGNGLLAIGRIASVNCVSLEEVPTLALRVVEYRRVT